MSIFFLIIAIISSTLILKHTLSKQLPERESVLWMFGCIIMIILSIFPKSMDNLAKFIGIDYPPSLYFLLAIIFLVLLIFRQMIQIEDSKRKSDEMAAKFALLESEVAELKEKLENKDKK